MVGRLLGTLISFLTVKLLTTKLGPAGFGEYAAILNYIAFFGTLADFGFYWILVKELALYPDDKKKSEYITGNILALRSVFALVVLSCAVVAVYLIPVGLIPILTPAVKLGIFMVAIATFWQSLNMTFVAIFQTHYRMDRPVLTELIGRVVSLAVLVPFLSLNRNVAWLVSAMVFGAVVNMILNVLFARPYIKATLQFDFTYWKSIFKESSMLGIVSVLALIYFKIDGLLLSVIKSSTEVGIYAAPYKVIEILNFFPAIFMGLVFTALIQSWKDNKDRAKMLINRSVEAMIVVASPILIGGIVLAKPIMTFISSSDYAQYATYTAVLFGHTVPINGIIILQLLLVAVTIDFFANIFGKGIIAFGSTKLLLWPNIIAVILNIALNLYLIPRWSYAGAALVTVLTELTVLIIQSILIRRFVTVIIPWDIIWRTALSVLVMGIVLSIFKDMNALIGVAVGTVVYLAVATRVGAISQDTLQLIMRRSG